MVEGCMDRFVEGFGLIAAEHRSGIDRTLAPLQLRRARYNMHFGQLKAAQQLLVSQIPKELPECL